MNPTRRHLLLGLAALVPAASLTPTMLLADSAKASSSESLATAPLVIHNPQGPHRLTVELARTPAQRRHGLMARDHLPAGAGMLFLYEREQSPRDGFWMYRTRIPLDIAFIDDEGRINAIRRMQPCESSQPDDCPVTYPGHPYRAALEVNAGAFETMGVAVGDCVSWPGSGHAC